MRNLASSDLESLQTTFTIPERVRFERSPSGLIRSVITTPHAEAHVYTHGAHVTHYQRVGDKQLLFLSKKSEFSPDTSIRGGIPVIFPWFAGKAGDPSAPLHGFARFAEWTVEEVTCAVDGSVTMRFGLNAGAATYSGWPHPYDLCLQIAVGRALSLKLALTNCSDSPVRYENGFHTYFAVGDVRLLSIVGLRGAEYIDKTDGMRRKTQTCERLAITGHTDRVYVGTTAACLIEDPMWNRRLLLKKEGSATTVVWNPWLEKARSLPDFGDDEWAGMVCVETCNAADNTRTAQPGESHVTRVTIRSETLPAR